MLKKLFFCLVVAALCWVGLSSASVATAQVDTSFYFAAPSSRWSPMEVTVLNAAQEPTINIRSTNTTGTVHFKLYEATQADLLNHLLYKRTNDGSWGESSIEQTVPFSTRNITPVAEFDQAIQTNTTGGLKSNTIALPLSGTGVWYLEGSIYNRTIHTMIVRSHLSALVHKGDNQNIYWVQGSDYQPVADASIQLFNSENSLTTLKELRTNQQGLVDDTFNDALDFALVSKGSDFTIIPVNLYNLLHRTSRNSYNSYSSFSQRAPGDKSFVFTDRFLYQPGDTVHFKAVIRQDDDADYTIVPKLYQVSLGDYEKAVWEKTYTLSELGSLDGSIELPADLEAEYLSLTVREVGEEGRYDYTTTTEIQVARYRKPDATLSVKTDKLLYLPGEKMKVKVKGNLFLGQPIRNQDVRYKLYQSEGQTYVKGDYTQVKFSTTLDGYESHTTPFKEGVLTFDERGEAELDLEVVNTTGFRQFWRIHVEYLDAAGTATNEAVQALVQPGDFVIETDGELPLFVNGSEQLFPIQLEKNKADAELAKVKVKAKFFMSDGSSGYRLIKDDIEVTTDQLGQALVPFKTVPYGNFKFEMEAPDKSGNRIRFLETFYVSNKDESEDGPGKIFTIILDKKEYQVGDTARVTIQAPAEINSVFVSLGRVYSRDYRVLPVQNGRASFEFTVLEKYQPNIFVQATSFLGSEIRQQELKVPVVTDDKEISVKITPGQPEYGPGETATFAIQATDQTGRPVQTELAFWVFDKSLLELHGVYWGGIFERFWNDRWFNIPTNYSYQGISGSGAEGGGGCFSPETLITMADGSQKRIDQVKAGDTVKTFADSGSQELVTAEVEDVYSVEVSGYLIINGYLKITPEHKLLVNSKWQTAGEIRRGDVVRLSNGQLERVSSIEWVRGKFQVYNLHIAKYHTFFADDVYVHNEKGGVRSIFKDTAYWNPSVMTDAQGQAQVTVVLPDNLTTWVAAAVAASTKTEVGEGQAELVVTKDVVVRPIFPLFLRAGDQISLAALLSNFSDKAREFEVEARFSAGPLTNASQSTKVGIDQLAELVWPVSVGQVPAGQVAQATFQVKAQDKNDSSVIDDVTQTLPVYEYGSSQTRYQKAQTTDGQASITMPVSLAAGTDPDRVAAALGLRTTKYPILEQEINDLLDRSSGGNYDAAGTLIAASIVAEYGDQLGFDAVTKRKVSSAVEQANKTLLENQQPNGMWQTYEGRIDYTAGRLAVEGLVLAQRAGLAVNQTMLTKVIGYYTNWKPELWTEKVEQQYVFSLLEGDQYARAKLDVTESFDPEWIARAALANSRQGFINSSVEQQKLLGLAKETPTQMAWLQDGYDRWWKHINNPTTWSARALIELDAEVDKADKALAYLYRNRQKQWWIEESAIMVLATVEYYQKTNQLAPNFSYQVALDGKVIGSGSVTPAQQTIQPLTLTADQLKSAQQLEVTQTGTGTLFAQLAQTEFYTTRELGAKNNNLQVERRYLSTKEAGEAAQVGDLVLVEFKVKGLGVGEQFVDIVDYVPSGLVIIDETLNNGNFDQNKNNSSWVNQQITDQGMKLQFTQLFSDEGTFSYKARIISEGVFDAPPAVISLSGDPTIWASSSADQLVIDGKNVLAQGPSFDRAIGDLIKSPNQTWETIKQVALVGVPAVCVGLGAVGYWQRAAIWAFIQQVKARFNR